MSCLTNLFRLLSTVVAFNIRAMLRWSTWACAAEASSVTVRIHTSDSISFGGHGEIYCGNSRDVAFNDDLLPFERFLTFSYGPPSIHRRKLAAPTAIFGCAFIEEPSTVAALRAPVWKCDRPTLIAYSSLHNSNVVNAISSTRQLPDCRMFGETSPVTRPSLHARTVAFLGVGGNRFPRRLPRISRVFAEGGTISSVRGGTGLEALTTCRTRAG